MTNVIELPKEKELVVFLMEKCVADSVDTMAAINISVLKRQYLRWQKSMPSVKVYYSIKCNAHPAILKTMHSIGSHFDCASPNEVL